MNKISFIIVVLFLGCTNFKEKSKNYQRESNQSTEFNQQIDVSSDTVPFKSFCNAIPNIILPFNIECYKGIVPVDHEIGDRITNSKYIGEAWSALGKIVKENYVLIIYNFDTDGTLDYLRTFNVNGEKIDEIKMFHSDCGPTIEEDFRVSFVSFGKDMKITRVDSIMTYKNELRNKKGTGENPVGVSEDFRNTYQLSDNGRFNVIK